MSSSNSPNLRQSSVLSVVVGLMISVSVGWAGWASNTIIDMSKRVAVLEQVVNEIPGIRDRLDLLLHAQGIEYKQNEQTKIHQH